MNENVKIAILSDNRSVEPFESEHGFSIVVKTPDRKILFDTGQFGVIFRNAGKLDIDLDKVDTIVLSHGHYDHSGSVAEVLQENLHSEVYLHSATFLPRYSIREGEAKSVQMALEDREAIITYDESQIHWTFAPRNITSEIGVTGPIPRKTAFEDTGGLFFLDPEGHEPDPIADDQGLWVRTPKGLVVCVGCSHSGIINILNYVLEVSGAEKIHTLIGGFHLANASEERISRTVEALNAFDIKHIIPCHCTGETAIEKIMKESTSTVTVGHAGMVHFI
jgi:7,8-dihydropterin-6-yl-methyl-4-(beta-D-ribofuranosyl)aminobenzene 5'-phosphate synthase